MPPTWSQTRGISGAWELEHVPSWSQASMNLSTQAGKLVPSCSVDISLKGLIWHGAEWEGEGNSISRSQHLMGSGQNRRKYWKLKYISKLSLLHFKTNTFPFQAALENYTDVECHLSSSGTIITLPLIPMSQQWLGCPCRVQGYTYLQQKPSLWCFTLIGTDKGDIRILGGPMFWKINPPSKNSKWRKMSAPGQKKSW